MAGQMIIAGLDLGSHSIKCVIGVHHDDGQVDIIGRGAHPSNGFQHGVVSNKAEAVKSVKAAVAEASLMADVDIKEVFLSVSTRHMQSFNTHGMARILGDSVNSDDVHAVIDMAMAIKLAPDTAVFHVVPQDYIVDHRAGIANPLGIKGVRLEVQGHLVTGQLARIEAIEAVCRQAKLNVVDAIYAPLASAETLLTNHAKDMGVILVDMGADTTEIAVFEGGCVVHAATLAIGGDSITQDIKDLLGTPLVEAEHLKRVYGCAERSLVMQDEEITLPGIGGRNQETVKRSYLCEIIEARAEEILHFVADELEQAGCTARYNGGVILTGGCSNLPGLVTLTKRILGIDDAIVGTPNGIQGLVDVVKKPRYSTATGLVLCGAQLKHLQWFSNRQIRLKRRGARRTLRFWQRA
ncbi:MAG: cell division protein FtsA [Myxococcota bacterium]|nr:cell division protein FtsA [Myxococcota bacterium]